MEGLDLVPFRVENSSFGARRRSMRVDLAWQEATGVPFDRMPHGLHRQQGPRLEYKEANSTKGSEVDNINHSILIHFAT